MDEDRVDLSPLDPTLDRAGVDARIATITRDAMAARARLVVERPDIFVALTTWARPALLAAGLILAVAVPALTRLRAGEHNAVTLVSAADALGIPAQVSDLLRTTRTPSLAELHAALGTAVER